MTPLAWTAATVTAIAVGWIIGATEPAAPRPPPGPPLTLLSLPAAALRIEHEVVEPMRERHLGMKFFSRAGPTFDEGSVRAILEEDIAPADGAIRFRVEVDRIRGKKGPETRWLGRIDRTSGAIDLAPPVADAKALPVWHPAKDLLPPRDG